MSAKTPTLTERVATLEILVPRIDALLQLVRSTTALSLDIGVPEVLEATRKALDVPRQHETNFSRLTTMWDATVFNYIAQPK